MVNHQFEKTAQGHRKEYVKQYATENEGEVWQTRKTVNNAIEKNQKFQGVLSTYFNYSRLIQPQEP